MEESGRYSNHLRVSFSRHSSWSYPDERMQTRSQSKEQRQLETCYCPSEVPKSPHQDLEFLSRTWSPSSSDFFQNLLPSLKNRSQEDHGKEKDEQETKKIKINFTEDTGTGMDQILILLSREKIVRSEREKHEALHGGWMDVGRVKAWLEREIFSSLSRGCRKKRKEELRLHLAQVHAALSVASLAAASAGIVGIVTWILWEGELDKKMNTVVASAAALVATVGAEAAESVGCSREQIQSAIRTGLATQDSADLVTLTATAATCLRGAATLELKVAACRQISEVQNILERGAELSIRTPEGKAQLRMVRIYLKHDRITLRLGKKYMRGVISTNKEFRIFNAIDNPKEGGFSRNSHGCYLITLATTGGTVQLLFEDQKQYIIWKSSILHFLCDK